MTSAAPLPVEPSPREESAPRAKTLSQGGINKRRHGHHHRPDPATSPMHRKDTRVGRERRGSPRESPIRKKKPYPIPERALHEARRVFLDPRCAHLPPKTRIVSVLADMDLPSKSRDVISVLAGRADNDGVCTWMSYDDLAERMQCTRNTAIGHIARCESHDVVETEPRRGKDGGCLKNKFRLKVPDAIWQAVSGAGDVQREPAPETERDHVACDAGDPDAQRELELEPEREPEPEGAESGIEASQAVSAPRAIEITPAPAPAGGIAVRPEWPPEEVAIAEMLALHAEDLPGLTSKFVVRLWRIVRKHRLGLVHVLRQILSAADLGHENLGALQAWVIRCVRSPIDERTPPLSAEAKALLQRVEDARAAHARARAEERAASAPPSPSASLVAAPAPVLAIEDLLEVIRREPGRTFDELLAPGCTAPLPNYTPRWPDVTPATLMPMLRKLEAQGLIRVERTARRGNRPVVGYYANARSRDGP